MKAHTCDTTTRTWMWSFPYCRTWISGKIERTREKTSNDSISFRPRDTEKLARVTVWQEQENPLIQNSKPNWRWCHSHARPDSERDVMRWRRWRWWCWWVLLLYWCFCYSLYDEVKRVSIFVWFHNGHLATGRVWCERYGGECNVLPLFSQFLEPLSLYCMQTKYHFFLPLCGWLFWSSQPFSVVKSWPC